ncbi:alpha/beta fold hydrolase [Rubellimicrobium rubrum]|uniref:Alpha/beta fold hydrolase n=1 Tax=Rubellimicrobium rubrum TaxID=2585369 RepID=A0A5C4MPF0_9RHOB|nr:alpha/beta fold hydrolase [Rubellimicrobium rubrum]TNC47706.1 alpha/beta fold hydrolase [Rubellimicrobium rubrum]
MHTQTAAATLAFQSNPVTSYGPVTLPVPGREVDLQMRVSAPAKGDHLPIILLSHGHGRSNFLSSMRGYGPLVDYYAAQGFVVIQPTHQNSKALAVEVTGSDRQLFWRSRAADMHFIIDHLDEIEAAVPGLAGRLAKDRIAVVGHSMGGHTAAMLAGMSVTDPDDGTVVRMEEPRIKAFVLFGAPGQGDLADFAAQHYPVFKGTDFSTMTRDALVVNGDKDKNPNFSDRDQWRADAFYKSPGPKSLLTVFDGEHIFGGISGYDTNETTDDSPERVLFVAEATVAYLRTALEADDGSWDAFQSTLRDNPSAQGRVESR